MGHTRFVKAVFLQARIDSSRLPGKVLLPLGGKTVIEIVMDALREINADYHVLLTDPESFSRLEGPAHKCGFGIFSGDKDDVLKRYCSASEEYGADYIIRATGDNPLVSAEMAERIFSLHINQKADYSAFTGMPYGAGVEAVRLEALLEAGRSAVKNYDREHVCPYLYHNPEKFRIFRPQAPEGYISPDLRITLDTEEDYRFLAGLFKRLYSGKPVRLDKVIDFCNSAEFTVNHGAG